MSFIIGLVGYSNAGKGTYCSFVKQKLKIPSLTTGDIVRAEVRNKGLKVDSHNIAKISDQIRERTKSHFMDVAKPYIEEMLQDSEVVIVDSLRELPDKQSLESCASGLKTIGVYASREFRYERMRLRDRQGDPLTFEEFLELEDRERSLGTDKLLKNVDARLFNNGNLRDFYNDSISKTKEIMQEWGING